MSHAAQVQALGEFANSAANSWGDEISQRVEESSLLLIHWLKFLNSYEKTGVADDLLAAAVSAIKEAAACLSLGLVRPALFSFRCQVDLVLTWIYYKDHRVEWRQVNSTAEGFKLKKDLLIYYEALKPGFGLKFGLLLKNHLRRIPDPYRLLSAHVHAQSIPVLPTVNDFSDMVRSRDECLECADIAFEVAEYLNDVLVSLYRAKWLALPLPIREAAVGRFGSHAEMSGFLG